MDSVVNYVRKELLDRWRNLESGGEKGYRAIQTGHKNTKEMMREEAPASLGKSCRIKDVVWTYSGVSPPE